MSTEIKTSHIFTGRNASTNRFYQDGKVQKTRSQDILADKAFFLPTLIYSAECHLLLPQRREYPDPHSTTQEQPQSSDLWPAHIYQPNLHDDALLSPSALLLLSGLTPGLNLQGEEAKT